MYNKKDIKNIDSFSRLTNKEKQIALYNKQCNYLKDFVSHNAITQQEYEKCINILKKKMLL